MTPSKYGALGIFVLVLVVFLPTPPQAGAQCVVTNTVVQDFTTLIIVDKTLSAATTCTLTMMNASFCFPSYAPANTAVLVASAFTATANPSCAWTCGCGSVTTDGSDGLPVELMEFSIDDSAEKISSHAKQIQEMGTSSKR